MKLTMRKSDHLGDWYIIERAEHDGREWLERTGPASMALRCSSRFSDADVEGTAFEMLALARAIKQRRRERFKRCAVDATSEPVKFCSPRNSTVEGETTLAEADALADMIVRELGGMS